MCTINSSPILSNEQGIDAENKLLPALVPADLTVNYRKAFLQHMVETLPKPVQNRVFILKHYHMQNLKLSEEFFREVYALEKSFYMKSCALFEARRNVIGGYVEAEPVEPYWNEEPDPTLEHIKNTTKFRHLTSMLQPMPYDAKGIPKFWLTVFRNVTLISDMVQEHDEPLLAHLLDIRIRYEPDSYIIEFVFEPNSYLHPTSLLLTKCYYLRHEADKDYPFAFEGPEIVSCEGCNIRWREGANLTLQTVEHGRQRKGLRHAQKVTPRDSFFRFFSPPLTEDLSLADEKTKIVLGLDYEVGYLLRTQIVPKAVLFYTGDIVDNIEEEFSTDATTSASSSSLQQEKPNTSSAMELN